MAPRNHMVSLLAATALFCLSRPDVPRAETPAETAAAFGLLGIWATDCTLPPSIANAYHAFIPAPGGNIAHELDYGSRRGAGEVQRAALTAGGIDLVVYFPAAAQTRQITIAKSGDGRIRTISDSFSSTNEYAIRDGVLLATGTYAPWQMRCR